MTRTVHTDAETRAYHCEVEQWAYSTHQLVVDRAWICVTTIRRTVTELGHFNGSYNVRLGAGSCYKTVTWIRLLLQLITREPRSRRLSERCCARCLSPV